MAEGSPFLSLTDDTTLDDALAASEETPVVLFKHSSTCPLSARANRKMKALATDGAIIYRLIVQEARALSGRIADQFDIRHESPQAIVLRDRTPVFDASHGGVSTTNLRNALTDDQSA